MMSLKQRLYGCLGAFLLMGTLVPSLDAQQAQKVKTRVGECDYDVLSGLAEVVRVEKVVDAAASPLQYDEYSIFFKFIAKEGGKLIANLQDTEMEFFLRTSGEKLHVGPQYLKQYQIRVGTKYAMKILQNNTGACAEKVLLGDQGGLPNDIFEAEKNVANVKKRRLEEQLANAEGRLEETTFDGTADPRNIPDDVKKAMEEEAKKKKEEEMRIKRENAFRKKEEELAKMNEPSPNTNPDENTNPDNTTTTTPSIITEPDNTTTTEPSTTTTTEPSTTTTTEPNTTPIKIDEEALRKELQAKIRKELAEEEAKKKKEELAKKQEEEAKKKKEDEKNAKARAKEEAKRKEEEAKQKKAEEERLKREKEIEEQQRKAEEERLKRELEAKLRSEILAEETEKKRLAEEEAARKKAEEERIAAEKKRQEDEIKRADCVYQTKITGTIQITSIKKLNEANESHLGYAEYEVKVKFIPSNVEDLPKATRKQWESEQTFVLDPQGSSANPSAAYIKKYGVSKDVRYQGFAQMVETGICNPIIMYSPQLPVDPAQLKIK